MSATQIKYLWRCEPDADRYVVVERDSGKVAAHFSYRNELTRGQAATLARIVAEESNAAAKVEAR